ncbi:MAG: BatA domain-containing protein [Planctomycetota bacterium]
MADLNWTHPALLWGLGAAAIPVAVHLLLRARPRRVRFPALRLMRAALNSGQRASRLRNLLLMVVRAALLAGTALLLAGPTCAPAADAFRANGPLACALVLDDSLSMSYRPRFGDPETLLDGARRAALELVETARSWPEGGRLAVFRAGGRDGRAPAGGHDRESAVATLNEPIRMPHAQPLGQALTAARTWLHEARGLVPRVVVFTDGTAAAWRDVRTAALAGVEGVTVRVVAPTAEFRDLGIRAVMTPRGIQPATAAVPLQVTLGAAGVPGRCELRVRAAHEVVLRSEPLEVPVDATRHVPLRLPPAPPGPHAAAVELEPEDLFDFDQRRFVCWETGPQPVAWLVFPAARAPERDLVALVLRNLLAPEVLAPDEQRVALRLVELSELAAPAALSADGAAAEDARPALVLVLPYGEEAVWAHHVLRRVVEAGTTAVLVPGSGSDAADWPGLREVLNEAPPEFEALPDRGTAIRQTQEVGGLLTEAESLELAQCRVERRVRFGTLRAGVQTAARFADGAPAIVWAPLGRGRIIALTTGPDPLWSELGVRAAGLLTWLHRLVSEAVGPPGAAASFSAGELTRQAFAALPASGSVQVSGPGVEQWARVAAGQPQEPWPTPAPGIYTLRARPTDAPAALYAVNWPAEEFDFTLINRDRLVRALGVEDVALEWLGAAPGQAGPVDRLEWLGDARGAAGFFLLALLMLEMWLAARRSARMRMAGVPTGEPETGVRVGTKGRRDGGT